MAHLAFLAHPYFTLRRILAFIPLFFIGGVAIGFLLGGLSLGPGWPLRFAASGLIGVCCGVIALTMEILAYRPLLRVPDRWAAAIRAPMFATAGVLGYLAGRWLVGTRTSGGVGTLLVMLAMCGLIGMVMGVSMFVYHTLKGRLRVSVERLKEAEFAERELVIARTMQKRLLPERELEGDGWRIVAVNDEAAFVAGDYYDVFPLGDDEIGLVVADVAGKGVGASLIMATAKALLPMLAPGRAPGDALTELSVRLSRDLSSREFVAIAFARVNFRTGELLLANAGLPDPLLVRDGRVEELTVEGPRIPAGLRSGKGYQTSRHVLTVRDRLLMFSDGFPEATDAGSGEPIGYPRAREIVAGAGGELGDWLEQIRASVHGNGEVPLSDDLTILALEMKS